jgi:long-chain acyl-CoA synthetase
VETALPRLQGVTATMNTLLEAIELAATDDPTRGALRFQDEEMSYATLHETSSQLAVSLLNMGFQPGQRLAVHWSNSPTTVQLFLACFKVGVVVVPVNTRLTVHEIRFVLSDSGASACFSEPCLSPLAIAAVEFGYDVPIFTSLPVFGRKQSSSFRHINEDAPCMIIYTSGTTSADPKGVLHTRRSAAKVIEIAASVWKGTEDVMLIASSMMHVSGALLTALPALMLHGTLILLPRFDPAQALHTIERNSGTSMFCLPWMAASLVAEQRLKPRNTSSWRRCLVGGDAVSSGLQQQFSDAFNFQLVEGFGMTECGVVAVNGGGDSRRGSFGRALPDCSLRIVSVDHEEAATNVPGELLVRSEANFARYWKSDDATVRVAIDDWYATGDMVRRDEDGFLWFLGRKGDLIVRFGCNISPLEVENAIDSHASVCAVGVAGLPDEAAGERVVALVVMQAGSCLDQGGVIAAAARSLAVYKLPEIVFVVSDLPRNALGKLHRPRLKDLAADLYGAG